VYIPDVAKDNLPQKKEGEREKKREKKPKRHIRLCKIGKKSRDFQK
jgi:hypothetical protein